MLVTYSKETEIASEEENFNQEDETVRYWYDLEINREGNIIGGEWHNHIHPDFIWVVADEYRPRTIFDHLLQNRLENYNGKTPLSLFIRNEALKAANNGDILYELINKLIELSK